MAYGIVCNPSMGRDEEKIRGLSVCLYSASIAQRAVKLKLDRDGSYREIMENGFSVLLSQGLYPPAIAKEMPILGIRNILSS